MQTRCHKNEISDYINSLAYNCTYTFFSDYEDGSGKPKENLIFLKYSDFDDVVRYFFTNLIDFLKTTHSYSTIQNHALFDSCIEDFFKHTSITTGRLSNKTKNKYAAIMSLSSTEFNALVDEIKYIKEFFVDKYIELLFNNIRNKFGAKLQQENEIFLCPYCQRNYINIIQKKELTIKPDLDHFYPKAKYPFLAATLENLIPACQVCNSRLKKEIDFFSHKHLHPLQPLENIFKKIKFSYLGNKNIYIQGKASLSTNEKQYLETFRIEEIYGTHTEILDEILEKNKKYNFVKKNHILKACPSLGITTLKSIVFHEYINIDDKKTPMSSLKKSLFEKIVK